MKLSTVTGIKPNPKKYTASSSLILNRRYVGVEIEAENIRDSSVFNSLNLWSVTGDGSLRNGGIELISDTMRGADVEDALLEAERALSKNGAEFSPRTSVHVHLDMRAASVKELQALVILYTIFEKFFFKMGGDESREYNNHCRAVTSIQAIQRTFAYMLMDDRQQIQYGINLWPKYMAFNVAPVATQGSVEFRHHVGTAQQTEIIQWINIIFSLARAARRNAEQPLQELIDQVCAGPQDLFSRIFPRFRHLWEDDLIESMMEGARVIQYSLGLAELMMAEQRSQQDQLEDMVPRGLDIPDVSDEDRRIPQKARAQLRETRTRRIGTTVDWEVNPLGEDN